MDFIAKPFGALLMLLYSVFQNYGVLLILFAIVVRLILLPFQMKGKRGMLRQTRLQPKIAELQKKHGANKTKLNEEMAKLYKEEGVSPASGCLWSFLPLPILIALFAVIRSPITMMMGVDGDLLKTVTEEIEGVKVYQAVGEIAKVIEQINGSLRDALSPAGNYFQIQWAQFIHDHWEAFKDFAQSGLKSVNFSFLGLNLGAEPQWDFLWNYKGSTWGQDFVLFLFPLISAGSQYLSTAINKKTNPTANPDAGGNQMKIMMMLMPLLSVYFGFIVPAALSLYWLVGTLLQIAQDFVLTKRYTRILDAEDAIKNEERLKKEAELEAKRIESERKKAEGIVDKNTGSNKSKRKKQKTEKQEQLEKAAEWEKKNDPSAGVEVYEPSRVGNRRYARGRAYDPDRYTRDGDAEGVQRLLGLPDDAEESDDDAVPDDSGLDEDTRLGDDIGVDDDDDDDYDDDDVDDDDDDYDDDDVDDDDDDFDDDGDDDDDDDIEPENSGER